MVNIFQLNKDDADFYRVLILGQEGIILSELPLHILAVASDANGRRKLTVILAALSLLLFSDIRFVTAAMTMVGCCFVVLAMRERTGMWCRRIQQSRTVAWVGVTVTTSN